MAKHSGSTLPLGRSSLSARQRAHSAGTEETVPETLTAGNRSISNSSYSIDTVKHVSHRNSPSRVGGLPVISRVALESTHRHPFRSRRSSLPSFPLCRQLEGAVCAPGEKLQFRRDFWASSSEPTTPRMPRIHHFFFGTLSQWPPTSVEASSPWQSQARIDGVPRRSKAVQGSPRPHPPAPQVC